MTYEVKFRDIDAAYFVKKRMHDSARARGEEIAELTIRKSTLYVDDSIIDDVLSRARSIGAKFSVDQLVEN